MDTTCFFMLLASVIAPEALIRVRLIGAAVAKTTLQLLHSHHWSLPVIFVFFRQAWFDGFRLFPGGLILPSFLPGQFPECTTGSRFAFNANFRLKTTAILTPARVDLL